MLKWRSPYLCLAFVLVCAMRGQASDLTFRRIAGNQPTPEFCSVSRDGLLLSYVDPQTGNLALRDLATGRTRALTKERSAVGAHAMWSIFSPDGGRIAFVWAGASGQEIRVADLDGSSVKTIWKEATRQDWMTLNDWSPDGHQFIIARTHYGTNTEILLMSVSDGAITPLKTQPTDTGRMSFSKDGRWIAHNGPQASGAPGSDIYLLSRDGSRDLPVVTHPANDSLLGWAADGTRLYFESDRTGVVGLWSVAVQDGHAALSALRIKDDIGRVAAAIGVTSRNSILYASTVSDMDIYEGGLDREMGTTKPNPNPVTRHYAGANSYPSWSPDDGAISYLANPASGERILFIQPQSGGQDRSFTPPLAWFNRPIWLRSGTIAVTGANLSGAEGIYGIDPKTGNVRLLLAKEENENVFHGEWSPDGRFYYNHHTDARTGIYRLDLKTREKETIYTRPARRRVAGGAISPDGRQLAFEEDDSGTAVSRLLLLQLDRKSEARELIRLAPGERFPCCRPFTWFPDSRRLLFVRSAGPDGVLWQVEINSGNARRLPIEAPGLMNPSLSPDGQRLLYQAGEIRWEIWAVENIPDSPR